MQLYQDSEQAMLPNIANVTQNRCHKRSSMCVVIGKRSHSNIQQKGEREDSPGVVSRQLRGSWNHIRQKIDFFCVKL